MNPAVILALISELYEQLNLKQQQLDELEAKLADGSANGDGKVPADFAATREG